MMGIFPHLTRALVPGLFLFLLGCSSSSKVTAPERETESNVPQYDESFDPLMLQDEDIEFPKNSAEVANVETLPLPETPAAPPPEAQANREVDGFRVQLFASKDIERTTLEKSEAEFVFAREGVAVYIEFDSPMYKVRIGDCRSREEAEQLREIARRNGYPSAWIVKTKVNTNPLLPRETPESLDFDNNPDIR